ncbi:response regulator [Pseudomonas koreensis]|nr:response regulator [Pseudomonas koreensis]MCU0092199.1 response regulator [Pseudomonas koreensis]
MSVSVLLVEDNQIMRTLIADAITLLDITVIDCGSAEDAVSVLESSSSIALVMTDIRMLRCMDGLDLAQVIWSRWPALPIIITSGHTTALDGLPANATFLAKPWTIDVLHRAIRAFLPK